MGKNNNNNNTINNNIGNNQISIINKMKTMIIEKIVILLMIIIISFISRGFAIFVHFILFILIYKIIIIVCFLNTNLIYEVFYNINHDARGQFFLHDSLKDLTNIYHTKL